MNQEKNIISFERGVLHFYLKNEYDATHLRFNQKIARVSQEGVTVNTGQSSEHGEFTLKAEEVERLAWGIQLVESYWNSNPLPHRHVLLTCGCIVNWDYTYDSKVSFHRYAWPGDHTEEAQTPLASLSCPSHPEPYYTNDHYFVVRFNEEDFVKEKDVPQGQVLLPCGCLVPLNKEKDLSSNPYYCCRTHNNNYYPFRYNEADEAALTKPEPNLVDTSSF